MDAIYMRFITFNFLENIYSLSVISCTVTLEQKVNAIASKGVAYKKEGVCNYSDINLNDLLQCKKTFLSKIVSLLLLVCKLQIFFLQKM